MLQGPTLYSLLISNDRLVCLVIHAFDDILDDDVLVSGNGLALLAPHNEISRDRAKETANKKKNPGHLKGKRPEETGRRFFRNLLPQYRLDDGTSLGSRRSGEDS